MAIYGWKLGYHWTPSWAHKLQSQAPSGPRRTPFPREVMDGPGDRSNHQAGFINPGLIFVGFIRYYRVHLCSSQILLNYYIHDRFHINLAWLSVSKPPRHLWSLCQAAEVHLQGSPKSPWWLEEHNFVQNPSRINRYIWMISCADESKRCTEIVEGLVSEAHVAISSHTADQIETPKL